MTAVDEKNTERIAWETNGELNRLNSLKKFVERIAEGDYVEIHCIEDDGTEVTAKGRAHTGHDYGRVVEGRLLVGNQLINSHNTISVVANVAPLPPLPAWADCTMVRDANDDYWTQNDKDFWTKLTYGISKFSRDACTTLELEQRSGSITPILDAEERPVLSDEDLDRAALAVTRSQYDFVSSVTDENVRSYGLYISALAALRETLGGAR